MCEVRVACLRRGGLLRVIRDRLEPAASPALSAMPRTRKFRDQGPDHDLIIWLGHTHRLTSGHLAGRFNPSKHKAGEIAGRPEIHRTASASAVSSSSRPPIALTWPAS